MSTADSAETTTAISSRDIRNNEFDAADIAVVVIYFVIVLGIGILSTLKSNRQTVSGYFLAGRYMYWMPVGASLFASNIGSEHFIGLAGSGAAAGLGVGAFEINAMVILQITGWIFLPVFIASRVCTLPEYMSKRFGGERIRTCLALLSLVLYVFTKISVNLFSGAIFIQQALQWNIYLAIFIILCISAACTVAGGLTAVIYTDTFQFFVMIIGASFVAIKAFIKVGGYEGLQEKYMNAIPSVTLNNTACGIPTERSWTMLRSVSDPYMPWLGFILGQTPASIWYWCTDQMMVQRLLAAKSLSHAQGGTLFAGFMKILPLFIIVMPGMISRILYTDEVACVDPEECYKYCQNSAGCSNTAYPRLVLDIMPTGFRGLMMAVMLAALISDLTSIYNSASTLFTMDIYPQIFKNPSVKRLLRVGRIFVFVMVGFSILWIPVIQSMQGGQLYIYIQSVSAYLAPPIAAVYLLAVLWKRMNEKGAFWALMFGLSIGATRMILDFLYVEPQCGLPDERPVIVKNFHYMYFACLLFWVSILSSIIISLSTEPPEDFHLIRTTYWTRNDEGEREDDRESLEMKKPEEAKEFRVEHNDINEVVINDESGVVYDESKKFTIALHNFFCSACHQKESKKDEIKAKPPEKHVENLTSLHQSTFQKVILSIFLSIALGISAFIFIYFSIEKPLKN